MLEQATLHRYSEKETTHCQTRYQSRVWVSWLIVEWDLYLAWLGLGPDWDVVVVVAAAPWPLRLNIEGIDAIVRNTGFWATVRIAQHIASECEFTGRFAEGCWCHEQALEQWAMREKARTSRTRTVRVTLQCLYVLFLCKSVIAGLLCKQKAASKARDCSWSPTLSLSLL